MPVKTPEDWDESLISALGSAAKSQTLSRGAPTPLRYPSRRGGSGKKNTSRTWQRQTLELSWSRRPTNFITHELSLPICARKETLFGRDSRAVRKAHSGITAF